MTYEDIRYDRDETGIVTITINRPEKLNAFRAETVDELIDAFQTAWRDRGCGVVILTGEGDRAFCVGGDQSARGEGGGYGTGSDTGGARHDVVAPFGEEQRRGPADAPGAAGDEGDGPPAVTHLRNRPKSGLRFSWKASVPSADSSVS